MLRPSPNHGTQRLPNDDGDFPSNHYPAYTIFGQTIHQPYILNIHILTTKVNVQKCVKLNAQNTNLLINFKTGIQKANILYTTLNKDEGCDPNKNYGIMQQIINHKIKTYFPVRVVKFNKRKPKKSNWITNGTINSISFRDNA